MEGEGTQAGVFEDAASCLKDALSQSIISCERNRDFVAKLKILSNNNRSLAVELDVFYNALSDMLLQMQRKVATVNSSLEGKTQAYKNELSACTPEEETSLRDEHIGSLLEHQVEVWLQISALYSKKLSEIQSQRKEEEEVDTMSWLSAAQTNYSLRQMEPLTCSEVQYLLFDPSASPECPTKLREKVHRSLQMYAEELKNKVDSSFKNLCGGFHSNATVIEQILRECCSDWEARSAGATPTVFQLDDDMHLRHVPHCTLRIGEGVVGPASDGMVKENMMEKRHLVQDLLGDMSTESLDAVVKLIFHQANPAVTSTPSKVAVQLLYGVADFVCVTPLRSRDNSVEVKKKGSKLEVVSSSLWSLRVDHRVSPLLAERDNRENLGIVKVKYTQEADLPSFLNSRMLLPPPKLTVTLTKAVVPSFLSSLHNQRPDYWGARNMALPPPSPGEPPDPQFPEHFEVSDSDQGESEPRFTRSKPVRVKKGSKAKDMTAVVDKQKEDGYSSSDSDKTDKTGTTIQTLTVENRASMSGPIDILQHIRGPEGLTAGALKEQEAKRKREGSSRPLNVEEPSNQRSAVRKPTRRADEFSKERSTVGPPAQLDTAIGVLSNKYNEYDYTTYLGDSVSQTSDYFSTPGSRNGSFKTDMRYSPPEMVRGSADRMSGSLSHRGRVTPSNDPWPKYPLQKSDSSASLVLHAVRSMSQENVPPEWGPLRGDYSYYPSDDRADTVSERSWQGSETSISAAQFKEEQMRQGKGGTIGGGKIKRSRSLEDMRKVAPSPSLHPEKWDSSQSLAAVGIYGDNAGRYFPDPSDQRARDRPVGNKSLPPSREGSLDRRGPGGFPPHMAGRQMIPSPGPPPNLGQAPPPGPPHMHPVRPPHHPPTGQYHHGSVSPYHMQHGYREFSPGPSPPMGPPFRPQGPPGPIPPPPHDGFRGQMMPHHRMPPPQMPNWEPNRFQPVHYGSYGPSPQPTPPVTPPPSNGRYPHSSPHPPSGQYPPHHGPPHETIPPFHEPHYPMRPRRRSPGPSPHGHMGPSPMDQYVQY